MNDVMDISSEIDDDSEEGSEVEHDIKEELRFFHSEEGLEENEMPRTADRQEFGQSLNHSKKDGVKDIHRESMLKAVIKISGYQGVGIRILVYQVLRISSSL